MMAQWAQPRCIPICLHSTERKAKADSITTHVKVSRSTGVIF